MSDEDDIFTDDDAFTNDSEGMANLRRAYKKLQKQAKEQATRLAEFEQQSKAQTLSDALKELGVDPKFAKLAAATGVEPGDGLKEWAAEYGLLPEETQEQGKDAFYSDEERQQAERINEASAVSDGKGTPQDLAAALQAATTPEDLMALLRQSKI